ncbi:MAG: phosphofructokinase [Candidatus Infernicultor aquiphilus]|uniref:Pyrophosphate--fructose 6-phosphate 1-phosphotransferase n=1 Tax=Candidatus Infernicultor aquiphilus TaxID=1805029 RepID=A0A1J5G9M3_9BACT|nr:diphosphate--fructose-6-phosphate 1-phosphotransferase [bacterium]OIP68996.1 MAG: phosphofructokinase [Candidatus Atribacteria bacterium CG2_30_33_13]PIU24909.1 MAG: phosphofructokinase [Candidatus Atribacteria bacterium CG08_land_8_20_14_0_20_33_29]PIW11265.1 MAG: phosphofructokinase [Candidatus Atribacteria bacterium CG17_big_fil_post_rev_8_21_14_2_50_34_11]PIX35037.1 MAG: phosphofructokinase [Candidatus Atribacteria bacterium CG_4_8_14_3_um_filter_34_18]PIY32940.1 MAG: phosphofructokinas
MKGNAIIGQFGGPTAVINSSLCGLIQEGLKSKKVEKVLGMRFGIQGFMQDEIFDLGKEDFQVIEGLRQTPSSALGSCRYTLKDEDFPLIIKQIKRYNIRYFFLIGGNGSMDTIRRVEKYCQKNNYKLNGIGIPKTVDNDLCGTDHAPGFASAARYVCLSVQQAGRLARDMQRVDKYVILQTVGRNTGWLAASAALVKKTESDAPHLIYIPERPLSKERFISEVKECINKNRWVSIVCGEGILWEDGTPVASLQTQNNLSNIEFGAMGGGSAALTLHKIINQETKYRGEFQITESLSMCAIDRASKIDLEEAYACGVKAIQLAEEGLSGVMVSLHRISSSPYQVELKTVSLNEVALHTRPMDDKYINNQGNFVTNEYIKYIQPLVGELPRYSELNFIKSK